MMLAMHHGVLPANLHYNKPNPNIEGLENGQLRVITETEPWNGGIVGISNFGFGGSNGNRNFPSTFSALELPLPHSVSLRAAHVILQGPPAREQSPQHENESTAEPLPDEVLLPLTARTQEGLQALLEDAAALPRRSLLALRPYLARAAAHRASTLPARGYLVCRPVPDSGDIEVVVSDVSLREAAPPDVWFVFNGVGSQWIGMGAPLYANRTCAASLRRCEVALAACAPDMAPLPTLLLQQHEHFQHDPRSLFAAITCTQIALFDLLVAYGIAADHFIGHSIGEVACAYADGCLSLEEAVQVAHARGDALVRADMKNGRMAAVQINSGDALSARLPPGVEIACVNSATSFTISGDVQAVEVFVAQLKSEGLLATVIDSGGRAFHSSHTVAAGDLLASLTEPIMTGRTRTRSKRWVSTCYGPDDASDACDTSYLVRNLTHPVLFHGAAAQIPAGSCVVEIGPHALLGSVLRQTVAGMQYVSFLNRKTAVAQRTSVVEGIGKCFAAGCSLSGLAACELPVEPYSGPHRLARLVAWRRDETFPLMGVKDSFMKPVAGQLQQNQQQLQLGVDFAQTHTIDLDQSEWAFLAQHVVSGRVVVPGVAYLYLVWKTLANRAGVPMAELPFEAKQIHFYRATMLMSTRTVELGIKLDDANQQFYVYDQSQLVARGDLVEQPSACVAAPDPSAWREGDLNVGRLYKRLASQGIQYGESFRGLQAASQDLRLAKMAWTGNWVTLFDSLLHLVFVMNMDAPVGVPVRLSGFRLDPRLAPSVNAAKEGTVLASMSPNSGVLRTGFVELVGLDTVPIATSTGREAELYGVAFVPNSHATALDDGVVDYAQTLRLYLERESRALMAHDGCTIPDFCRRTAKLIEEANREAYGAEATLDEAKLAQFLNDPHCVALQLARHCFAEPESLLKDALPLLKAFPGYANLYRQDRIMGVAPSIATILSLLDIAYENTRAGSTGGAFRMCEVAVGTGALASTVLPILTRYQNSHYMLTDVSADAFPELQREFELYSDNTSYTTWDPCTAHPAAEQAVQLVMASNAAPAVFYSRPALRGMRDRLVEGGFLLVHTLRASGHTVALGLLGYVDTYWPDSHMTRAQWAQLLDEEGFDLVCDYSRDTLDSFLLARKRRQTQPTAPIEEYAYVAQAAAHVSQLQARVRRVAELGTGARLWLRGDVDSAPGLPGMATTLAHEHGENVRTLFCADGLPLPPARLAIAHALDLVHNVWKGGELGSYRWVPLKEPESPADAPAAQQPNLKLHVGKQGDLDSFSWKTGPVLASGTPVCDVRAFALNFKDSLVATGDMAERFAGPHGLVFGLEYAGKASSGERVFGMCMSGISTKIPLDNPHTYWRVPDSWSYEQAATVPIVYCTVYATLLRAGARKGQSILVHSGAGGIGQALLHVAFGMGLKVFATVGNDEKKEALLELFPQLDRRNIGHSRSDSFRTLVLERTSGRGVDICLSAATGHIFRASLDCLAHSGHFIDIGRSGMIDNTNLGMEVFRKGISFHAGSVDILMHYDSYALAEVHAAVQDGMDRGVVRPLPIELYRPSELTKAVKRIYRGAHKGKLVISFAEERVESSAAAACVPLQPRVQLHPDKEYLVVGGLGGLGFELVQWLAERGARHITITSRSGVRGAYQREVLASLASKRRLKVTVTDANVASLADARTLVKHIEAERPLGGVFNVAMVLADKRFMDQDEKSFAAASNIKAAGAANLDLVTREICGGLDIFLVTSSIVAYFGNEGQANYGYGNSAMERVVEQRFADGLPALAMQLPAISDVGWLLDNSHRVDISSLPMAHVNKSCVLESLEVLLLQRGTAVATINLPKLVKNKQYVQPAGGASHGAKQLLPAVLEVMGLAKLPATVSPGTTLTEMGMDSLMAVEIRQVLAKDFGRDLRLKDIRKLTVEDVKNLASPAAAAPLQTAPEPRWSHHTDLADMKKVVDDFAWAGLEPARPLHDAKTIFMTGVTGLVGRVVLAELLAQPVLEGASFVCLVRAHDRAAALGRIKLAVSEAGIAWQDDWTARVDAVTGDISQPQLGLPSAVFEDLCRSVDAVYHIAASVNLIEPYSDLRSVNACSIQHIMQLCCTHRLKPLSYASTLGLFPEFIHMNSGQFRDYPEISEEQEPDIALMERLWKPTNFGYVFTKWVSESTCRHALKRGLPVTIFRISLTTTIAKSGYSAKDGASFSFALSQLSRRTVCNGGMEKFPITSACDTAKLIVAISTHPGNARHSTYHLHDPRYLRQEDLDRLRLENDMDFPKQSFQQWWPAVVGRKGDPMRFLRPFVRNTEQDLWATSADQKHPGPLVKASNRNVRDLLGEVSFKDSLTVLAKGVLWAAVQPDLAVHFPPVDLSVERLLLLASKLTGGLSDLGPTARLDWLQVLVDSLNSEARLTLKGRMAARSMLVVRIASRLRLVQQLKDCTDIGREAVCAPLFIVGLNRTGTTFLHRALAQLPSVRVLTPAEMLAHHLEGPDATTRAQQYIDLIKGDIDHIHLVEPDRAEECFLMMEESFLSWSYTVMFNVPSYRQLLVREAASPEPYELHKQYLQLHQWRAKQNRAHAAAASESTPPPQWILKMPFHLMSLDALTQVYPDASFVLTQRDSASVVASYCSLVRESRRVHTDQVDPGAIGEAELELLATMHGHAQALALSTRTSKDKARNKLLLVRFEELVKEPLLQVTRVMQHAGVAGGSLSDADHAAMQKHLHAAGGRHDKTRHAHNYSLEQYGLDESTVAKAMTAAASVGVKQVATLPKFANSRAA